MKRLGVDPETPLAVQQWRSGFPSSYDPRDEQLLIQTIDLIAVNYPARAAGVTRHVRIPPPIVYTP